MKTRNKPATEVVIAEWAKNANEIVRVLLQVYRGRTVVSIRTWYRGSDGRLKAGRNGINLSVAQHLPKLRRALKSAHNLVKKFSASTSQLTGGR